MILSVIPVIKEVKTVRLLKLFYDNFATCKLS